MNRDPIDDLLRIQKSTGKTNSGSFVDDFALRLKKLKEPKMTHVGILPAPATGPVLPSAKNDHTVYNYSQSKASSSQTGFSNGGDYFF